MKMALLCYFSLFSAILFAHGPLAQLVERRTFNPGVIGSIPIRPTTHNPQYQAF
jgi:hypothetical protein